MNNTILNLNEKDFNVIKKLLLGRKNTKLYQRRRTKNM